MGFYAAIAIGVNESSFAFTFFALIKSVASLVAVRLLLALSKPNSSPQKVYCPHSLTIVVTSGGKKPAHVFLQYTFGGDVGGRTRVQNTFNCQFTTIKLVYYLDFYSISLSSNISFSHLQSGQRKSSSRSSNLPYFFSSYW